MTRKSDKEVPEEIKRARYIFGTKELTKKPITYDTKEYLEAEQKKTWTLLGEEMERQRILKIIDDFFERRVDHYKISPHLIEALKKRIEAKK